MQDNISVLIATILLVIIIVVFPIYNVATRQDSMAKNIVVEITTNFADSVRSKGYLTQKDYETFLYDLNKTGNIYDVELEIHKPILLPSNDETYEEKYKIEYTKTIIKVMEDSVIAGENLTTNENSVIKQGVYYLNEDYKFYVRLRNTNATQAQVLLSSVFGGNYENRISVNYGGVIKASEWKRSDNAKITGTNIALSRPMDLTTPNGKEYKYGEIFTYVDEYTGEKNTVYGIVARLKDDPNAVNGGITFILSYTDVEFPGIDKDNKIGREQHVSTFITSVGFDANQRTVEELPDTGPNNYKYKITFKDITFDTSSQVYANAYLQINSGSAESLTGELGLVKSVDFAIIYEQEDRITFDLESTPDVINNTVVEPDANNKKAITFTGTARLGSGVTYGYIKEIVFEITNTTPSGTITETRTIAANQITGKASTTYIFEQGTGSVAAYAVDSRGNHSKKEIVGFIIMKDYLDQSLTGFGITEMNSTKITGATIKSYSFYVNTPSHSTTMGKDWWRVTGLVRNTDTWEVINPLNSSWVPSQPTGQTKVANKASGSGVNTGTIMINDTARYEQLKFEYCTDPSHSGRSCLSGATIRFRVSYQFND
ncbi:MAG: hypothetical protein PHR25_02620 [Clostridia bacterium]|nr:hypothetical protein [Clostridia bacterium]MDD4375653.1 hypothetical protein [Clostridia bacterium]